MFEFNTGTGVSATSYVTVSEADNIIQFYGTNDDKIQWVELSAETKEILLVRSTSLIDNSYNFMGARTVVGTDETLGQRLQWPRRDVPREGRYRDYQYEDVILPYNLIPEQIKIGTTLLASTLLVENRESVSPYNEVKSIDAGDVGLVFRDTNEATSNSYAIPLRIHDWVKIYGTLKSGLNQLNQGWNYAIGRR